jgi:hypothetical protein
MDTPDISEIGMSCLGGELLVQSRNPGAGCIDQVFAPDQMFFAGSTVLELDFVVGSPGPNIPGGHVVVHVRPIDFRGQGRGQTESGIVGLGIGILEYRGKILLAKHGKSLHLLGGQSAGRCKVLTPCKYIIELAACLNHPGRAFVVLVHRDVEAQRVDQMGSRFQKNPSFLEGLTDEFEIVIFKIADSPVDQFGTLPGSSVSEILFFHQKGGIPPRGCLSGHSGPIDATTDNSDLIIIA